MLIDYDVAVEGARLLFNDLHPREERPEWLSRCTTISYGKDKSSRFVVDFCVTPRETNDAVVYFQVAVDPVTAEREVLLDKDLSEFLPEELVGFFEEDSLRYKLSRLKRKE